MTQPESQAGTRRTLSPKWLRVGLVAAIAVGLVVVRLTGWFDGEPGVGDCVTAKGATSFEVVDCTSAGAQAKIVGIAKAKLTSAEFRGSPDACGAFPSADVRLWTGDTGELGTVYCARSLDGTPAR